MISEFLFFSLIHISGYTSKYILMLYKWCQLNETLVEIGQLLNKDPMTLILYIWSYVKHIEYRFLMQSKTKTL